MTDIKETLLPWSSADQKSGQLVWDIVHKDLEQILLAAYRAADPSLQQMPRDVLAEETQKFACISRGDFNDTYFGIQEKITHRLAEKVDYVSYLSQVYSRYAGGLLQTLVSKKPRFRGNMSELVGSLTRSVLSDVAVVMYHYFAHLNGIADQARAAAQAEREIRSKEDQDVIQTVSLALKALAEGDLTHRVQGLPERVAALQQNFNATAEQLEQAMRQISNNTKDVMANAEGIKQSADDLSRRTEQQAATLEETSAALTQITQRVRKTTDETQQAHDVVNAARVDAEHAGAVVQTTIEAINKIDESSKEITSIVGIINDLAFQTNILALNASVEAARAGDSGRGFAVVANEVRILAQRSGEAAKEIATLIGTSGKQVKAGVSLVLEAGSSLQRIVSQVTQINVLVSNIAAAAQGQAASIGELNIAMGDMELTTQKNAAVAEESAAASHNLSTMANELTRLVAQFTIGHGGGQSIGRSGMALLEGGKTRQAIGF